MPQSGSAIRPGALTRCLTLRLRGKTLGDPSLGFAGSKFPLGDRKFRNRQPGAKHLARALLRGGFASMPFAHHGTKHLDDALADFRTFGHHSIKIGLLKLEQDGRLQRGHMG